MLVGSRDRQDKKDSKKLKCVTIMGKDKIANRC